MRTREICPRCGRNLGSQLWPCSCSDADMLREIDGRKWRVLFYYACFMLAFGLIALTTIPR